MNYLAKNLDGRSFTLLNKHLNDLRQDVLNDGNHQLTPDSFLIFLDKIRNLSPNENLNTAIVQKFQAVDISVITPKNLMQAYQNHSIDFKFEEKLRMGQIKQFASNVVPKPRFLFDNYKVQEDLYSETKAPETDSEVEMSDGETSESEITPALKSQQQQQQKHDDDYFSFFNSHENIILKPESSFKGLRSFLVNLPIDYYILL